MQPTDRKGNKFLICLSQPPQKVFLCHSCLPACIPQALLDLGGSPNYKDRRGLTPLYHTAMVGGDPRCCELLLYNRAYIGTTDENGWQEIHQVRSYMII